MHLNPPVQGLSVDGMHIEGAGVEHDWPISFVPSVLQLEGQVMTSQPVAPLFPELQAPVQAASMSLTANAEQVPFFPGKSHALQAAPQVVSQQTPSTQFPLTHSAPAPVPPHEAPFTFLGSWHLLPEQTFPETQSASAPQVIGQAPAAHL